MINNIPRIGNFTSSEIVALTKTGKGLNGFGVPAITYVSETNMERRLGRSLTDESSARPMTWGKLLEERTFDLLGLEYSLCSTDTIIHKTIPYWCGSPDGVKEDTVIDIKCPMTLKSFCQLVDPLYNVVQDMTQDEQGIWCINQVRENHKDGEKFYWQLVSNAILTNSIFAELIVYVPYLSELPEVKQMAQMVDTQSLSKHYWIAMAAEDELPYLKDGGYYKNLNTIRFKVPQSDRDLLTAKVLLAGEMLIKQPSVSIAEHKLELNGYSY